MTSTLKQIFQAHRKYQFKQFLGVELSNREVLAALRFTRYLKRVHPQKGTKLQKCLHRSLVRANQYAIIETLNVKKSPRYLPDTKAYCQTYAYDLVTAMGGYLPRVWWTPSAISKLSLGKPVQPLYKSTVREQTLTGLANWLTFWGKSFGWKKARDMDQAQAAANRGKVVIILAPSSRDQGGVAGHVTVVLAESKTHQARRSKSGTVAAPLQSSGGARKSLVKYGYTKFRWWKRSKERPKPGAAWIFDGRRKSPIATPEELGVP